jgi:hypothetical protein
MRMVSAALVLALAACVPHPPEGAPPPPSGQCDADPAASVVGREATAELVAEARRLSGARQVRVIRPGQMVTMEYSAERLNLHVDARNRVERLACGYGRGRAKAAQSLTGVTGTPGTSARKAKRFPASG